MDNENLDILNRYLSDESAIPSAEWVGEMMGKYPCFVLPAVLRLKRCCDIQAEERQKLLSFVALRFPDRKTLYELVGEDGAKFVGFYPQQQPEQLDTDTTINRFLDSYGADDANEINALSNLIFNPVGDYRFDDDDEPALPSAPKDEQDRLIDSFLQGGNVAAAPIAADSTSVPQPPELPKESVSVAREDSGTLSESLAKIYIKQKRYEKAYKILLEISSKHPEKAIHVRDQLRFLRKVMVAKGISVNGI